MCAENGDSRFKMRHRFFLELRFNYRGQNIYKVLLKIIGTNPLF